MERALCLACGEEKHSAWVPCPECDFEPVGVEDRARHFWIAERCMDQGQMDEIQRAVRAGEAPPFEEQEVERLIEELEKESLVGAAAFGLLVGVLPIFGLAGLLLAVAWLLGRFGA